jgi:hypothetical protein
MARYLLGYGWTHIFSEDGTDRERSTRFAFDTENRTLPVMDITRDNKWRAASDAEKADLLDSLVGANAEALENPEDWDLERSSTLPDWD